MIEIPEWYVKPPIIFDYVQKAVDSEEPFSILLIGKYGTGKTTLARCVYDEIFRRNKERRKFSAIFSNTEAIYQEYLDALEMRGQDNIDERKKISQYLCRELVVIDDLGEEKSTASHNLIGTLMCNLYDNYSEGIFNKCLITTNYGPKELTDRYGLRVFARIEEHFAILQYEDDILRGKKGLVNKKQ